MINIKKLLQQGHDKQDAERAVGEVRKLGTLRGGSVGCVLTSDGDMSNGFDITGVCPREAHARFLGFEDVIEPDKKIMFGLGLSNEDIWSDLLDKAGFEGTILREEELGLEWDIDGVKASGRPDIVLVGKDEEKLGLELKMVASVWTARNVLLESKPKMGHLIQAGNYAYRMDIPFQLWYTSYVNLTGPDFITRIVPKRGEPGSQHIEYSLGHMVDKKRGTGKIFKKIHVYNQDWDASNSFLKEKYGVTHYNFKHIKPFRIGYDLQWFDGFLSWRKIGDKEWIDTPISKQGIDDYYRIVSTAGKTKTLPPRPLAINAYGEKEKFNVDDYSTLQHISDSTDEYQEWVDQMQKQWSKIK